jgi:quinol monooxygenase YgiN
MPGAFAIIARFVAKPGCEDELLAVLLEAAAIALDEEPGCRRFEILGGVDDLGVPQPNIFMTNELFDDYEAVEAHRNSWRTPIRRDRIRSLVEPGAVRIEMAVIAGAA